MEMTWKLVLHKEDICIRLCIAGGILKNKYHWTRIYDWTDRIEDLIASLILVDHNPLYQLQAW